MDKVYIWLSMSDMSVKKLYDLAISYENLQDLWDTKSYNLHIMRYLDGNEWQELLNIRDSGKFDKMMEKLEKSQIKYLTLNNPNYPEKLRNTDMPPLVLYYRGNIDLINTRCFGIVGSRVCTRYGREQTERFAQEISKAGFSIVSGLAEGIDGCAHSGTLKAKGKAIGVLAGGLDNIFPAINVNLARSVVENGGVILSEKAPDVMPKKYTFVQRNRIIAALSDGVLVTEAGKSSGALYTVNFALDMGKEIFALPGNCTSSASEGTNNLIKQFYSCCVTSPQDVINIMNENFVNIEEDKPVQAKFDIKFTLKPEELMVFEFVKNEEKHFDEILEKLNIEAKKLLGLLTTMEIRGLIKKLPGNYFIVKD